MIEDLKNTEIVNKVGGRFKLSSLIQKRMIELMQGSRPLIEDTEGKTMMEIVVEEIRDDKICIDTDAPKSGKPDKPAFKL
jgi:DNA-directed RNA polymerase subunit omega